MWRFASFLYKSPPPLLTLTICSLGSRLQSARVISSPSKKLRLETLTSSMLLWSISSGSGERRYSSSFCSVFRSPRSRPVKRHEIYKNSCNLSLIRYSVWANNLVLTVLNCHGFSWGLLLQLLHPYTDQPHGGSISSWDKPSCTL